MTREEAIEIVKKNWPEGRHQIKAALEFLVPELKENEDEKTRKEIISTIENTTQLDWNISKEKMLAWLEKQKDQKPDIEICPRTKSKSFTEVYMKGWNDAKKEQKPAEWSEEDMSMMGRIRSIIEKYAFSQSAVDVNGELCEQEYIDADNWLKHLKDRVLLQPKQEWSEEDEKKLRTVISLMKASRAVDPFYDKMCLEGWLKSLRPQPHWKPSEEQMYILNWVANILLNHDSIVEEEAAKKLQSLYNDLQKL